MVPTLENHFIIDDFTVHVPQEIGTLVSLNSKFSHGLTLVKFLRRFGCPLTRYESVIFSQHQEEFKKLNVDMVAIGFDTKGLKKFSVGGYWKGELYLNPERSLYKSFNLNRQGKMKAMCNRIQGKNRNLLTAAKSELRGNSKGDNLQLGGTYLVDRNGEIVYSFSQKHIYDLPDVQEVLKICRDKYTPELEISDNSDLEEAEMELDLDFEECISIDTLFEKDKFLDSLFEKQITPTSNCDTFYESENVSLACINSLKNHFFRAPPPNLNIHVAETA